MKLRAYQRSAVADVVSTLATTSRAQLVAACGTGKTVMAAMATRRISRGRVLVLLPTLDLLWQTAETYLHVYPSTTRVVAVCSAEEWSAGSGAGQVSAVTTSSERLQELVRAGQEEVVVLSTYASLPVIEQAHDAGMSTWDVAVIDEAHRTAGRVGRPWAAIHDQARIPAQRRLYMTATPRVVDEDENSETPVASMDDPAIFGPRAHTLSFGDAIRDGVLSDYRVVVPVVGKRQLRQLLTAPTEAGHLDLDMVTATQVALLRSAQQHQLTRVASFHSRLHSAQVMADTLARTAQAMPADTYPTPVWARYISGRHTSRQRQGLLEEFADIQDGTAVLANARVLGEGVDIPTLDGLVFADPKSSVIDIVQAVGRALRLGSGTGPATILVPVIHAREDTDDSVLTSSDYRPVWRTLAALRAHDDRIDAQLTRVATDPQAEHVPSSVQLDTSLASHTISTADLAVGIAVRTVGQKSLEWRRGYKAAREYHQRHGHLLVPQDHRTTDGIRLGDWISWQRYQRRRGSLSAGRIAALDAIGMEWSPIDTQWDRTWAAAQAYVQRHGHLAIASTETIGDIPVGQTIHNYRHRNSRRAADRRAQLATLDPWWNPPWGIRWQRSYYTLRDYHHHYGSAEVARTWRTDEGFHLGEWVHTQKLNWNHLHADQQQLLLDLGFQPELSSPREQAWQQGYEAAAAYARTHGHLRVPQSYRTDHGYTLGTWINSVRARYRRGKLTDEQITELDQLGMIWNTREQQ